MNQAQDPDQQKKNPFRRFTVFVKPHRGRILFVLVFLFFESGLRLVNPMIIQTYVDRVLIDQDKALLYVLMGSFFLVFVLTKIMNFGQQMLSRMITERVVFDVAIRLTRKVMEMPLGFHKHHGVGYLISRITNDISACQQMIVDALVRAISALFTFSIGLAVLFYLNTRLATLSLMIMPVFALTMRMYKGQLQERSHAIQESIAREMALLQEILSGYFTVTLFRRTRWELIRTLRQHKKIILNRFSLFYKEYKLGVAIGAVANMGPILLMWFGYNEVVSGRLSIGEYVAFVAYISMLFGPATTFANLSAELRRAGAPIARIFEILDFKNPIQDPPEPIIFQGLKNKIEFKHVSFTYRDKPDWSLKAFNLAINKGETIALVGKSGSGKTTIANLLARFYDIQGGSIKLDNVDLRLFKVASIRKHIGVVTQDTFLFNDTVLYNLRYGRPDATMEDILSACRKADCLDFIQNLTDGFDTICGERGNNLSGGQRQRISIARTLLVNPSILILDEATSSLDQESTKAIQDAIPHLMAGRTTIIITHRIASLAHTDRIIVMRDGRIVEEGHFDDLMARGEHFRQIAAITEETS